MKVRSLSMAAAASAAALFLSTANCGGDSNVTGAAGHGGKGGTTGTAGTGSAGTGSAGTGSAGTAAAGTGAAGTAAGGAGGTMGDGGTVDIPAALAVPAGATLKFRAHAVGTQIYTCKATVAAADGGTDAGTTTYAWTFKAPQADLFDDTNKKIGTHYAGPTWMSNDGSDIVGMAAANVASPLADAIPWLLLKVISHMGSGVFADVTYVQRINTTKGKAPATGCEAGTVDTEMAVAYTADYLFYKGGAGGDGGVTADWPFTTVTIPTEIVPAAGPTLKLKLHAIGVQIYTCTASTPAADAGADAGATTYAWVLKAPDAKLYDDTNAEMGTHGAGPNWTSKDGSIVTAARIGSANSPLADAIPWLLLQAATHTGAGVFADVTFVQRVNTTKGKAPATGCDGASVNAEVKVGYTADYYFLKGDVTAADGGAG